MDNQEGKKSFTVKDNRRFDEKGSERVTTGESFSMKESSGNTPGASTTTTPEVSFSSFIASLGTQVLMQLGIIPAPEGFPVDREGARQSIEILGMLDLKTKGNLSPDETALLRDVLHSARMAFIQK
jgi:Domain of unknown function (DUF1844)